MTDSVAKTIILVVEDEVLVGLLAEQMLADAGYRTIAAHHAQEALAILEARHGGVDLVLSDIMMPGDVDGVKLSYIIRERWPVVPIVLVSAVPPGRMPDNVRFLPKPFLEAQLLDIVSAALLEGRAFASQGAPVVPKMLGVQQAANPTPEPDKN